MEINFDYAYLFVKYFWHDTCILLIPHSLPHSQFLTFPHFLCPKIVEIDFVNRSVNCARNAYMYIVYVQLNFIMIKKTY